MKLVKWLRIRNLDLLTFTVKRFTGIALTVFFIIHLIDISILAFSKQYYEFLLGLSKTPLGLLIDSLLWVTLVLHASTSLYSALIGMGIFVEKRKQLLLASWIIATVISFIGVIMLCI